MLSLIGAHLYKIDGSGFFTLAVTRLGAATMASPPPQSPEGSPRRPQSAFDFVIPVALIPPNPSLTVTRTHTFRMTIRHPKIIRDLRNIPPPDAVFLRYARAQMNARRRAEAQLNAAPPPAGQMSPVQPSKRKRDGDDDRRIHSPKRRSSK